MYVFYFCTGHADRKAQQTSKNARRASSKFNYKRDAGRWMSHRYFLFQAMIGISQIAQDVLGNFSLHISNVILLV